MINNKAKYLVIILIALFFASTNELSAKEAAENYNSESHNFIETVNYAALDSFNYNLIVKNLSSNAFINQHDYNYHLNLLPGFFLNFIMPSIKPKIYLDISILRI